MGVTDGLVRLSIGLEDGEDLLADIRQALQGGGADITATNYTT